MRSKIAFLILSMLMVPIRGWASCGPPQCSPPQPTIVEIPSSIESCLSRGLYKGESVRKQFPESLYNGWIYDDDVTIVGQTTYWPEQKICEYYYYPGYRRQLPDISRAELMQLHTHDPDIEYGNCPSNSPHSCLGQQIGASCQSTSGRGVCSLTPLTAGGFCLCYSTSNRDNRISSIQIAGAICCHRYKTPNPTNCVPDPCQD